MNHPKHPTCQCNECTGVVPHSDKEAVTKFNAELARVKAEYRDYRVHYDRIFASSVVVSTEIGRAHV